MTRAAPESPPVRLSMGSLQQVPTAHRPTVDPGSLSIGVVHLGLGAFHRGHAAVFTEDAMAADGSSSWGICGVTQRTDDVARRLRPQDCLYSSLARDAEQASVRVIGSVREVLFAGAEPEAVLARIAAPTTRIVSTTVTETGYNHDPATGRLRVEDEETAADLAGRAPRTVIGQLVRGFDARRKADAGPVTVLCCDNLSRNGAAVRSLVEQFCDRLPAGGEDLREWITGNVTFPSTMVDRIVPATTEQVLAEVQRRLGVRDEAAVAGEPFSQWVIEDDFAAARPAYERAGVQLTPDVAPYETVKLRLVNGTNSTMAYLGALAGLGTIAEAITTPEFEGLTRRLMAEEMTPTIAPPPGLDLAVYRETVVGRFANPTLRHSTVQVALDGSQKLPQRLLDPIRLMLGKGIEPYWATLAVAAWMRYVWAGQTDEGAPLQLQDPMAGRLQSLAHAAGDPAGVVTNLLSVTEVFGDDLPDHEAFRELLVAHLTRLTRYGAIRAVRDALAEAR